MPSLLVFKLYILINSNSVLGYPYVGVCTETKRIFSICDQHIDISILAKDDTTTFDEDYIATSRTFTFDLDALDTIIEKYIGQREYSITAHFNERAYITLAYRSVRDDKYKEYDLFIDYPDKSVVNLVQRILSLMQEIKKQVDVID